MELNMYVRNRCILESDSCGLPILSVFIGNDNLVIKKQEVEGRMGNPSIKKRRGGVGGGGVLGWERK